jgi:RHS repeat-associated protein
VLETFTPTSGIPEKTFFIHGPGIDEPLALVRGGQYYTYHADGLGSITAIVDTTRNVVERYSYDTYGKPTQQTGFRNSFTYTGREWDKETGLYYYRARYYDPMDGRFIGKDPISYMGGINVFAYVQNNPINWIDPFGLARIINGMIYNDSGQLIGEVGLEAPNPFLDPVNYLGFGGGIANLLKSGLSSLSKTGSQCAINAARTEAGNLAEQLALKEAEAGAGTRIMQGKINDRLYPGDIWAKMQHIHTTPEGTNIVIHYWQNLLNGIRTGFKFK